jgi:hypothetical protein
MTADVESNLRGRMSEAFGDNGWRYSVRDKLACMRMPETIQRNLRSSKNFNRRCQKSTARITSWIYPLYIALGGLSHQFWGRHNHIMPINMSIKTRGFINY